MTKEELWQAVLARIQFNISQANFSTWFKNTNIVKRNKEQITISVPNNFSKEWLENKYGDLILQILRSLDNNIKEVLFTVKYNNLKIKKSSFSFPETNQLDFQEFNIDKETNLNPRYTFENFIVGPFNELAQAAAWAITKNPGKIYNPLFIYGGVGLGKTHLLQSIGNEIVNKLPRKTVKYVPCEKFTSGVVSSIRNGNIEKFKSIYKKINVLIIDDIQFLAGKEKTQEEFFHIFNALYEKNNQIVLSSDRPPKAISALEERLKSRFEGGMIADIGFPDIETRIAILKVKAQERNIDLSPDVYDYIASNIQRNIREMEGALNRLIVYQKVNNKPPTIDIVKQLLKNLIFTPSKIVNSQKIIQTVANFYDLKEKDIFTPSRKKEIVEPRQVAMYLLKTELKYSFPFIGRKFGGKDHTTVIYAYEKVLKKLKNDLNFNEELNIIKQKIYTG